MIETIPNYLLQAEEMDAITERILALITETLPAEPTLQPILPLVTKDRAALLKALSNSRGSAFTAKISAADEVRDDAFVVFRNACESATLRRKMPDLMAAGDLLMRLITAQDYSLQNLGNSAQTGALNSLFVALKESAAAAAVTLIGADELLSELTEAQSSFETLINSRTDEQAARDYPQLAKAKAKLCKRLQALLEMIDTLNEADDADARPEIDVLIGRINEALVSIIAPARARRTRADGEDVAPPVVPQP